MYLIGPNLHKISSAIHREVFVFSVIPIIQTDLNEFMNALPNHSKVDRAPGRVPKMLFNLPAIVGFPKQGTNVK